MALCSLWAEWRSDCRIALALWRELLDEDVVFLFLELDVWVNRRMKDTDRAFGLNLDEWVDLSFTDPRVQKSYS